VKNFVDQTQERSFSTQSALTRLSPHATRTSAVGNRAKLCKFRFLRIAADRADRSELPLSAPVVGDLAG
jgi:hypothetical protein